MHTIDAHNQIAGRDYTETTSCTLCERLGNV
jgi:hypothetical protein